MKNKNSNKLMIGAILGAILLSTLSISSQHLFASITSSNSANSTEQNLVAYTTGALRPVILVPGTGGSKTYANINSWNTDSAGLVWPELELPWGFDDDDLAYNLTQKFASSKNPSATKLVPSCVNEQNPNGVKRCDVTSVYVKDGNFGLSEVTNIVDFLGYQETYLAPMVNALVAQGYIPGVNLFAMPYDMRLAWDLQNTKLAAKIDQALAASGADKVYIMGHSQGARIIDNLLLDTPAYQDKVAGVIRMGALGTGAGVSIRAGMSELGYDLGLDLFGFGLENGTGYLISKYSPAIFQMASTLAYENDVRNVYGRKASIHHLEWISNNLYPDVAAISNATQARIYTQSWMDNNVIETYVNTQNDASESASYNIPVLNVVSSGISTEIGQDAHEEIYGLDFDAVYGDGDGTVPAISSQVSRSRSSSADKTTFTVSGVEHMSIPKDGAAINQMISWINSRGNVTPAGAMASLNTSDLKADLLASENTVSEELSDSLKTMNAVAFAVKTKEGRTLDVIINDPSTGASENVTIELSNGKVIRQAEGQLDLIINVLANTDEETGNKKNVEVQFVAEEGKLFNIEMTSNDNMTLRARGYQTGEFEDTDSNSKHTIETQKIKLAKDDSISFNLGDLSLESAVEPFTIELDGDLD